MQARRRRAGHLREGVRHEVCGAAEFGLSEPGSLLRHRVEFFRLHPAEHRGRGLVVARRECAHDDEVAEPLEEILDEAARILPRLDDAVDRLEGALGVLRPERIDDLAEESAVRVAEQRDGALVHDGVTLGPGDELVEEREGVTHRATPRTDDERQHAGLDLHALALAQVADVVEHLRWRHETERIVVRARADRADDLVGLGRREDELDVLRRLLDDLEERVETLRRDHVGLVEDEDLVTVTCGGEHGTLAKVTRVIHTVVARGVDLDDIERTAAVAGQLDAARAHVTRGVGGPLVAVEAARQDAGGCRLATASRTAEEVGVVDAIGAECRREWIGHL
jgi:hypothetical protein